MIELGGKIAIVTGSASGIGAGVAELFVSLGAKVLLTDIRTGEGETIAGRLGPGAYFLEHDVRDASRWQDVVAFAEDRLGPVNVLVNNAGVTQAGKPLQICTEEEFRVVSEINTLGTFLGMRAVAPAMERAGGGAIVNSSSAAGTRGRRGSIGYVTSKWAVTGLTKCAALDLAPLGIRVNSVHPGIIETPMAHSVLQPGVDISKLEFIRNLPIPRVGTVGDVAPLYAFLASDLSAYCTGGAYPVDGGWAAN
jgi:3alpha(or 20beta)-hydroxysteroid dehydrogenase